MTKSVPVALLILLAANNNLLLSFSAVQLKPEQASQIEYQELILYQTLVRWIDKQIMKGGKQSKIWLLYFDCIKRFKFISILFKHHLSYTYREDFMSSKVHSATWKVSAMK